jgi:hypothetical protein
LEKGSEITICFPKRNEHGTKVASISVTANTYNEYALKLSEIKFALEKAPKEFEFDVGGLNGLEEFEDNFEAANPSRRTFCNELKERGTGEKSNEAPNFKNGAINSSKTFNFSFAAGDFNGNK